MRAAHVGVLAMTGCRAAITHGYIRRRSEVIFTAPPLVGGVEDALCWSCCGYRPFRQRTRGLQRQLLRSVGAWFGDNGMTAKKRVGIGKRRKKPSREGRKGKGRRTNFCFFLFCLNKHHNSGSQCTQTYSSPHLRPHLPDQDTYRRQHYGRPDHSTQRR